MTAKRKQIAVILSGCGFLDGAEIHEATLTLLAIHRHGADFQCYAPDKAQHHVVNHLDGSEMSESRNVLVESARIARGKILPLDAFDESKHDALVLPGGFGAAKNLSNFAFQGAECTIEPAVAQAIQRVYQAKKPIGALCIAPTLLTKIIGGARVTIGNDGQTASAIASMGGEHESRGHGEICIDEKNMLVTTPCYMLDSRVDQIADGADRVIAKILDMLG